jgi:DNA-binding response OmpR family regulator
MSSSGTSGRNAFVVSWDEDDAIHLASVLSEAGWLVALEHGDSLKAWKRIKEGKPDVVIVDMRRKPGASNELIRNMGNRKHTSAIPIVRLEGDDGVPADNIVRAADEAAPASR